MGSQQENSSGREPRQVCIESLVPNPSGNQFVMIHEWALRITDGDACSAALLNVLRSVNDARYRAGEDEWFQRTSAWWSDSLQNLYSRPTIRKAFERLKCLGCIEIEEADGDQRGHWYRLDVAAVRAAIDRQTPKEVAATPKEASGTPKDFSGSDIHSSRAQDPSLDPFLNQQQADLGVTDSAEQPSAPPAAARDDSFGRTLQAIKARGFPSTRLGEKWELGDTGARTSGFTDEQLARVIGGRDFDTGGVRNPVGMILRAVDALTAENCAGAVTFGPTADSVRVAETQARNGMDEGRERLERYAKCGDGDIARLAQSAFQRVNPQTYAGVAVAA